MTVDQTCVITLTGKKDTPDMLDAKIKWTPRLDLKDNDKNHPSVISAFANLIKALSDSGDTTVQKATSK
ncbi:hypothetical protein GQ472_06140 [archaeon]|nr:hypothetical protein [archaeon]